MNSREKQHVISLMRAGLANFKPFSYADFNRYGNIYIAKDGKPASINPPELKYKKYLEDNIDFLNGLIFLASIVEVLVRSYRTNKGKPFAYTDQDGIKSDSFPVAMAQARSIIMLCNNQITFEEFFGQLEGAEEAYGAALGAVTGTGTTHNDGLRILHEKLAAINKQYIDHRDGLCQELKTAYLQDNKNGVIIFGKSKMRHDLAMVYSYQKESDSETSDYSNDDSTVEIFKPKADK